MDAIAASSLHIQLDSYYASPRRKGQGGANQVQLIEARLQRSATLPKYDITIKPKATETQVN
jgi:hypothetical protein